jgi:hypothetical protein
MPKRETQRTWDVRRVEVPASPCSNIAGIPRGRRQLTVRALHDMRSSSSNHIGVCVRGSAIKLTGRNSTGPEPATHSRQNLPMKQHRDVGTRRRFSCVKPVADPLESTLSCARHSDGYNTLFKVSGSGIALRYTGHLRTFPRVWTTQQCRHAIL